MFSLVLTSMPLSSTQFQDVDAGVMLAAFRPLRHLLILRDPRALVKQISSLELVVHDCALLRPQMVVFLTHEDENAVGEVGGEAAGEDWDSDSEFQEHLSRYI